MTKTQKSVTFKDFIPSAITEGPEEFVKILSKQEGTRLMPGYVTINYKIVRVTIQKKSTGEKISTYGKLITDKIWEALDGRMLVVPGKYTGIYSCPNGAWIALISYDDDAPRTLFVQDEKNRKNTNGSLRIESVRGEKR